MCMLDYIVHACMLTAHLASTLQDSGSGPPQPFPVDDVPRHVHLSVHETPLLQCPDLDVVISFDLGSLDGQTFGFDGSNLLQGHGLVEGGRAGEDITQYKH